MLASLRRTAAPRSFRPPLLRRMLSSKTPSTPMEVLRPAPEEGNWISDAPGILSAAVRGQLNDRMDQLNADGRGQMAIVLLENVRHSRLLPGIGAYGNFTEELFDHWGVGQADLNDGVVLAVFREGRRVEVRTGAGIRQSLPDAWLLDMQQRDMVPHFRFGDHEAGIERGAHLILDRLEGRSGQAIQGQQVEARIAVAGTGQLVASHSGGSKQAGQRAGSFGSGRVAPPPRRTQVSGAGGGSRGGSETSGDARLFQGTAVGAVLLIMYLEKRAWEERERRKRLCLACNGIASTDERRARDLASANAVGLVLMDYVPPPRPRSVLSRAGDGNNEGNGDGNDDDGASHDGGLSQSERHSLGPRSRWHVGPQALTACELEERRVGSVRFRLLRCPQCGGERVLKEAVSSGYEACRSCECRTCHASSDTLVHATESHGGRVQHNSHCEHCGVRRTWETLTPRLPPPSSSSSSGGGGGFGGGSSSGGGGAGSSWLLEPQGKHDLEERWWQIPPSEHAVHAMAKALAAAGWREEPRQR